MICDICEKEYKNVEAHKRMAHSSVKTAEEIVQILYDDVVKPICAGNGVLLKSLAKMSDEEKECYLNVAERIRS